ncbi:oligoendopeptidase F [Peribacillus sp. SCS-37]|uniref:oligoendopeptidase F n=1 Tax=Paraperibacillus esterisolvens TaxID=3115296 RepID=UPI0039064924
MKSIILSCLAAVVLTAGTAPLQINAAKALKTEKPHYKTRAEIPSHYRWKIEHIYPDQKSWEKDLARAVTLSHRFQKNYEGRLSQSPRVMKDAIQDYSVLSRITEKVYVYAKLQLDADPGKPQLQTAVSKAEDMYQAVSSHLSWFTPEAVRLSKRKMETYAASKELSPYKSFLRNIFKDKDHTLSGSQELLLSRLSPLGGTAPSVYGTLEKDVSFGYIKTDGRKVKLTRSNYSGFMESDNRKERSLAYHKLYGTLERFQDTYANILSAKVKASTINAEIRHYPSARDASLASDSIPPEVYDNLIAVVHKGLPDLHRFMELKKELLGVRELHMYDVNAPLLKESTGYIPYEKAVKMVTEGLKTMGPDYTNMLKQAFREGWIDVYPTEDKRSGAYQWGAYDTHPYVLLNYQGTKNDVSTIAHELGHAMHSVMSNKAQNYLDAGYATFTAETASTLNENLLWDSEYKKAKSKEKKMQLLYQRLEDFRTTLFRQTQFAEFEKEIHKMDAAGTPLTAENLKNLYSRLNQKYYGPAVKRDEEIGLEWARIPHLYNHNFYVYQYATSFAASTALTAQIKREGKPAVDRIKRELLMKGGSKDPISILRNTGVDMSDEKPIEECLKVFKDTLDELEDLAADKKK